MANVAFCPRCGRQNVKGDPFCGMCGQNLTGEVSTSAAPTPPTVAPLRAAPPPSPTGYPPYGYPPYAYGYPPHAYAPPRIRRADAVSMVTATFHAWGQDVLVYLGLYLVLGAISVGITLGLTFALLGSALPTATFPPTSATFSLSFLVRAVLAIVLAAALNAVVAALFTATVTYYAISKRRGTPVSWSAAFRVGARRFLSVLGGGLLLGLLIAGIVLLPLSVLLAGLFTFSPALLLGGALALLILVPVVIFLVIALSLFAPAVMMEGVGAVESLFRSWSLTRGHRLSIFGATLLVAVVGAVVSFAATLPAGLSGNAVASIAGQVAATMVTASWGILLSAMAYELITEERRAWGFSAPVAPVSSP